jgi:hypothetical protein
MNAFSSLMKSLNSDRFFNIFSFVVLTFSLLIVLYPIYCL